MTLQLAAFYTSDLQELSQRPLRNDSAAPTNKTLLDILENKCSCMALDLTAAGYYFKKKLPCLHPFQVLSDRELDTVQARMYRIFSTVRAARLSEKVWSANWFEQDYLLHAFTLSTALVAESLAEWFIQQKGKEWYFAQSTSPRILTSSSLSNDIASSVWTTMLPDAARPIPLTAPATAPCFAPSDYSLLKNRICFFMHEFEHFRMAPFVHHTAAKRDVAVVSNNVMHGFAMENKKVEFPTLFQLPCPPMPTPENEVEPFVDLFVSLLPPGLEWLVRHLVTERWACFESTYRHWLDIMRENPPAICVVSDNLLPECDIPILAARQCNIPVVSIPHAAVNSKTFGMPRALDSDAMIFAMPLMAEIQKTVTPHIPAYSIRQLRNEMEYPATKKDLVHKKKNHVLFITTVQQGIDRLWYGNLPNLYLEQLTEFQKLYIERADHVSLSYKGHPGRPEFALFYLADIPSTQLLPYNTNLQSAFNGVGAVVMYNYRGAPLVYAMKRGIPVIFLNTNTHYEKCEKLLQGDGDQKALRGDVEVVTADEAWKAIDRLFADSEWRTEILARQRDFAQASFHLGKTDWLHLVDELQQLKS